MSEAVQPERVVVIDDDQAMRLSCRKILARMGLEVETFEDGARGLEGAARLKPALVVVDLKMPGLTGMEVIARLRDIDPRVVIVVITGYATIDTAVEAMKCGAWDFLPKPFSPDELRLIVNRALERRRLALESERCEIERSLEKRRFVTFVSHQLQSPLAAIRQYLDALGQLDDAPGAEARRAEWTARCVKRTEELQRLIRDWLTLARVEGDRLSVARETVDLAGVAATILDGYREAAAAESVRLVCDLAEGICRVTGDRTCITVLFDNLVSNAVKYNRPGGSVTIAGRLEGGEAVVEVADTGVGIPPQCLPRLFDEFFRVRGEGCRKVPGSGLGLHICKRIASEMGGAIEVESVLGAGSTFRVRLPASHDAA